MLSLEFRWTGVQFDITQAPIYRGCTGELLKINSNNHKLAMRSTVHRRAEACGLAVVRGFASVPVEEISKNPTGRPHGGRTEHLETELNHISQKK